MYPFIRMVKELVIYRKAEPLPLTGTHVSRHRCWPWDIDLWLELNNGRSLTLFDLGRIPLAGRVGLIRTLRRERWGLTMAGCSVRWRARVRAFETVEMQSRCVGWDDRFIYIEQSMWKRDGRCANHVLYRGALTDRAGIVAPARVMRAMGRAEPSPPLPGWADAWIGSDATRPWPPDRVSA